MMEDSLQTHFGNNLARRYVNEEYKTICVYNMICGILSLEILSM